MPVQTSLRQEFHKFTSEKPRDLAHLYQMVKEHFDKLSNNLTLMRNQIQLNSVNSQTTVATQAASALSAAASSSSSVKLRSQTVSFSANTTLHVVFSSPLAGTFALSSLRVLDSSGAAVQDFTISNITANGFDFLCPVDGSLIYLAVVNQ